MLIRKKCRKYCRNTSKFGRKITKPTCNATKLGRNTTIDVATQPLTSATQRTPHVTKSTRIVCSIEIQHPIPNNPF